MVTFNDLSRICRDDRSRRLLSVTLEVVGLCDMKFSADDIAEELQEAEISPSTRSTLRVEGALERFMPDGRYSPLKGLSKKAEDERQDDHQIVTDLDRFFYQDQ